MPSFSRELETLPKMPILKKIILLVIVVTIALSVVILVGPLLANLFSGSQNSDYTVLTFALYQTVTYSQGGVDYEFSYVSAGPGNLLQVSLDGQTESYSAFAGANYTPFDLNVLIVSANDVIVLNVSPA
jgi:hypothetical protein